MVCEVAFGDTSLDCGAEQNVGGPLVKSGENGEMMCGG